MKGRAEETWAGAPRSIQCGSWCWLCWWFWCWLWPWLLLYSQQEDVEGIQLCVRLWCWPVLMTGSGTAMSATTCRGTRGAGSGARSSAPRMGPRWPCPGGRGRWSSSGASRATLITGLGCGDRASACSGWMAAASTRRLRSTAKESVCICMTGLSRVQAAPSHGRTSAASPSADVREVMDKGCSPRWGLTASPLPPVQRGVERSFPQLLVQVGPAGFEMWWELPCTASTGASSMELISFSSWDHRRTHLASLTNCTDLLLNSGNGAGALTAR